MSPQIQRSLQHRRLPKPLSPQVTRTHLHTHTSLRNDQRYSFNFSLSLPLSWCETLTTEDPTRPNTRLRYCPTVCLFPLQHTCTLSDVHSKTKQIQASKKKKKGCFFFPSCLYVFCVFRLFAAHVIYIYIKNGNISVSICLI